MKKMFASAGIVLLAVLASGLSSGEDKQLIGARFPALSPDGEHIAFSYMGDLWTVPSEGGRAFRLTDHVAYDREPVWSPDGRLLAFSSDRNGGNDVYIIDAEGGTPRQLTFHSGNDIAGGFTPDGQWVVFTSDRYSSSGIFKIHIDGGPAYPLMDTAWGWPYQAKISPDGRDLLFSLGMENRYWWRRGYRGSNTAKIWMKGLDDAEARLLVSGQSNCFWPQWSYDKKKVYFVSDRERGVKNIWSLSLSGSAVNPVTRFDEGDVKWLSTAYQKPAAVYERDFELWITDLETGESRPVPILAPTETKENRFFFEENEQVSEYKISPDGKKIAAVVRGDIFVLASDGGYARNITQTPWRERDIDWDKKSRNVVYVSDTGANPDLYLKSALGEEKARRLTQSPEDEISPKFSPNGEWIAYYRGKRQVRLYHISSQEDFLLWEDEFGGRFAGDFTWSPDSSYLAGVVRGNGNTDIFAVNIQTKEKHLLTDTAYDENSPCWSPDGKFMLFISNRFGHSFPEFTGKWDMYQLHFEPQKPEFKEDAFEELFTEKKTDKKEEKKETEPQIDVQFRLQDIERQTETVTNTLGDDSEIALSPEDKETVYFVSNIDGKRHLWKTSLKEKERGSYSPFMPQIENLRGLQWDGKGKYLFYLSRGRIGRIDVGRKQNKTISFQTKIKVDKIADYEQVLGELYYTLKYYFYDDELHDVNWDDLYQRFRPVLQQVREDNDFYDYANEMIGYLNSSHTGISGPRGRRTEQPSAHPGMRWSHEEGKVILKRIITDGPLYAHRDKIRPGDEILSIEGEKVRPGQNLWKLLNGKQGQRVQVTFLGKAAGEPVTVSLEPISSGEEKRLILEEWIQSRKEWVKEHTEDRVAYIYMRAMGRNDLRRFLKELERDAVPRKGLILDLRYNFGGNVHDRVIQALTKPVYAKWRVRGLSETPQSTFGLSNKPVVLLTNEVTLSDGEMTANGFKTLDRGPVIGNTTYGWLIFTTGVGLMNGGYFRLPFWGCYTLDGEDLETSGGVKPDIEVINDLNDIIQERDPQLEKAVEKALELIKK